jgi:hypothetical protein
MFHTEIQTNDICSSLFDSFIRAVLEDLRVLEQQQRESQRTLANARVTKDHHLQQQTALETQIEQQKYKNGALRAQLRQFRESLSCGTREMGARRLAGARAGDDIRAFEQRLKMGLRAQRMNIMLVRKMDSLIIRLENKGAILKRLNAESKEKVNTLEKEILSTKRRELALRTSIQAEVSTAHKLIDEVATLRAESTKLEQELLSAQSSEESTRLRVEAIDAQIESENKSRTQAMTELQEQLRGYEKATQDMVAEDNILTTSFEEKSRDLLDQKRPIVSIQQKEGHTPSPCSTDFQEPVPVFDKIKLTALQEANETKINAQKTKNVLLKESIKKLRADMKNVRGEVAHNRDQVSSLIDSTRRQEAVEKDRLEKIAAFQKELEREREEADKLGKSSRDVQNERDTEAANHARVIAEVDEAIMKDHEAIETLQRELGTEEASEKQMTDVWEAEKIEYDRSLEESKDRVESAQEALGGMEHRAEQVSNECARMLQEGLEEIEVQKVTRMEKTKAQISRVHQSKCK